MDTNVESPFDHATTNLRSPIEFEIIGTKDCVSICENLIQDVAATSASTTTTRNRRVRPDYLTIPTIHHQNAVEQIEDSIHHRDPGSSGGSTLLPTVISPIIQKHPVLATPLGPDDSANNLLSPNVKADALPTHEALFTTGEQHHDEIPPILATSASTTTIIKTNSPNQDRHSSLSSSPSSSCSVISSEFTPPKSLYLHTETPHDSCRSLASGYASDDDAVSVDSSLQSNKRDQKAKKQFQSSKRRRSVVPDTLSSSLPSPVNSSTIKIPPQPDKKPKQPKNQKQKQKNTTDAKKKKHNYSQNACGFVEDPTRGWTTIRHSNTAFPDFDVDVTCSTRMDKAIRSVPARLYSSMKYTFSISAPEVSSEMIVARLSIVESGTLKEITKARDGNPIFQTGGSDSALFRDSTTSSSSNCPQPSASQQQQYVLHTTIPAKLNTNYGWADHRPQFRWVLSFFLSSDLTKPLLSKRSASFAVFARKPNNSQSKKTETRSRKRARKAVESEEDDVEEEEAKLNDDEDDEDEEEDHQECDTEQPNTPPPVVASACPPSSSSDPIEQDTKLESAFLSKCEALFEWIQQLPHDHTKSRCLDLLRSKLQLNQVDSPTPTSSFLQSPQ